MTLTLPYSNRQRQGKSEFGYKIIEYYVKIGKPILIAAHNPQKTLARLQKRFPNFVFTVRTDGNIIPHKKPSPCSKGSC